MRHRRLVMPVALTIAAIVIFLIGTRFPTLQPDTDSPGTEANLPVLSVEKLQPVLDEQGRRVFLAGEIELRIPASENPISAAAPSDQSGLVQVTLCWPKDPVTGDCPGIENVAMIFIRGGKKIDPTVDDGMAKLRQELPIQEGPFDTDMDGIWEFRVPDAKTVSFYALIEPSSFGRHVIARCYGGPRCSAWIYAAPGLSAQYNFDKQNLALWPQIDAQIRSYIHSFIVEE